MFLVRCFRVIFLVVPNLLLLSAAVALQRVLRKRKNDSNVIKAQSDSQPETCPCVWSCYLMSSGVLRHYIKS